MKRAEILKIAKPIIFCTDMVRAIQREVDPKTMTRRVIKPVFSHYDTGIEFAYWFGGAARFKSDNHTALCNRIPPHKAGDILYVRETFYQYGEWYDTVERNEYDEPVYKHTFVPKVGHPIYFEDTLPEDIEVKHGFKSGLGYYKRPALFMPKAAARIFIRVTNVKAEQLQDITEEDARAEGLEKMFDYLPKSEYEDWARRTREFKTQEEQPYKNYLWHGHFGEYGLGNKQSDAWPYQYSGYDTAVGSFSSLWELINSARGYGWNINPWVWAYTFERITDIEEVAA